MDWAKAAVAISSAVKLTNALSPLFHVIVLQLEAAMPQKGMGQQKLAQAKQILQNIATGLNVAVSDFEYAWPIIAPILSGIVAAFNLSNGWSAAIAGITGIVSAVNDASVNQNAS